MSPIASTSSLKALIRRDGLVAMSAIDPLSHQPIEVRILPEKWLQPPLAERFSRRLHLVKLIQSSSVRRLLRYDLEHRPASVTVDGLMVRYLNEPSTLVREIDSWHSAGRLVEAVAACHRLGLAIGEAGFSEIAVDRNNELWIDPLLSLDDDTAMDLQRLWQALSDCLCKPTDLKEPSVANLLQLGRDCDFADEPPSIQQWCDCFGITPSHLQANIVAQNGTLDQDPDSNQTGDLAIEDTPTGDIAIESIHASIKANTANRFASSLPCAPGETLGRFRLDRMLGRGGMGVVFSATDVATKERVAVKVLRNDSSDIGQAVRRFRKEARLLGDIQNDYVTRLIEVGYDRSLHFMVMELVEGTNLARWLRDNRVPDPESALRLIADIARGLVDAHASGIVHRDVKPENVLLHRSDSGEKGPPLSIADYQVKLTDFGIARYVHQSSSMELTKAGAMLGTPIYMAPEQCKGSATVTPAVDVYALGITLFQLLTGSPPFTDTDPMKLVTMHVFDPPPPVQRLNPLVSDEIAQIVTRALAKDPDQRYGDASQMLKEITRVLQGEPSEMHLHPRLPDASEKAVVQRQYHWDLNSSPAELWSFVANTERLNKAIGLSPVTWESVHDPVHGLRRFGSFKIAGIRVHWEEHPFEWIEGSRFGVLREFKSGPFRVFMSVVQLAALPSGGTRLTHTLKIEPVGTLGRLLIKVEIDRKSQRNLATVYQRIDESLQARKKSLQLALPAAVRDPFESKVSLTSTQRQRIRSRCAKLVPRGVDPEVALRMEEYLLHAAPQSLSQIRPILLAEELSLDSDAVIDACLVAATEGLLTLQWDLLCPMCRVAAVNVAALSEISSHTNCQACNVEFQTDVSDAIEMVFCAHTEVRDVDTQIYCIGGPSHSPHVVAQVRLAARERLELEVQLNPGDYVLRGPRLARRQPLRVRREHAPSEAEFELSELGVSTHTPVLRSGHQSLTLVNDSDVAHVARLERQIARENVITATAALALPRFRKLFPNQTFDRETPIMSDDMTLLSSGLVDLQLLYSRLGDADAYRLIRQSLDTQAQIITARGGTVTKSVGEGMLAAFRQCENAVAAAVEMVDTVLDDDTAGLLSICIGLHRGQVLITTQNDKLDYFGSAARLAQVLPTLGKGIVMTDAVFSDPELQVRFRDLFASGKIERNEIPGYGTHLLMKIF